MDDIDLKEIVDSGEQLPDEYSGDDVVGEEFVGRSVVFDGEKFVVADEE